VAVAPPPGAAPKPSEVGSAHADGLEHLPFVARTRGCTIVLEAEDYGKPFELVNAIQFLAGVVR